MRIIFGILFLVFTFTHAKEFGTLATASQTGKYYKIGSDISSLLRTYNIKLTPIVTGGSFENISILNGNFTENKNTFFGIVQKDVISYYNYLQYNDSSTGILDKIPAVLSLGLEQIHIIAKEDADFDYDQRKTFKVWCGDENGESCVTAKYIEKAYNFKFVYVNAKKENRFERLNDGTIDLIISVIEAPASDFADLKGYKLIDFPTNFIMEDMYAHSIITKKEYPWLESDIHAYAVPRVLVTNLTDEKYNPIIENLVKILVLNKSYLGKTYGEYWDRIDFNYTAFKKMSKIAKETVLKTSQK